MNTRGLGDVSKWLPPEEFALKLEKLARSKSYKKD
jgi:hypothetical protein